MQNFSEQIELFEESSTFSPKLYIFKNSELGKLRSVLPIRELSKMLPDQTGAGRSSWFDNAGQIALLFLSNYLRLDDATLLKRLNSDWELQMFCGRQFEVNERIKDMSLLTYIRKRISKYLHLEGFQEVLLRHWQPYMENTQAVAMDAVVYEAGEKNPTRVKLLWGACEWMYNLQILLCGSLKIKRPRNRFLDQRMKQFEYQKRKKGSQRLNKRRRKQLIYLLGKLTGQTQRIINQHSQQVVLTRSQRERLQLCKRIIKEQRYLLIHPPSKLPDRIVSFSQPHLRPIVRGKENKAVEYGVKAHILQTDSICYVEHSSFHPFYEGNRMKGAILKHKQLFGSCMHVAADKLYASNKNRSWIKANDIFHNFPRKGPKSKDPHEGQLRMMLSKARNNSLEGAFGNHKNHYKLGKIRVRSPESQTLMVYMGIMTANAKEISKRIAA